MFNWFKKYFIPHTDNDHKPHFLRTSVAVFVLVLVLFVELLFVSHIFISRNTDFLAAVLPAVLVDLTNESRAESEQNTLNVNPLLQVAAQAKADDMATKGYFAHTSPEGVAPWYFFSSAGYIFSHAGENLAIEFYDSKDVHDAWMDSPKHQANILNNNFSEIGIGTARGMYEGRNVLFITQFFGTPVSTNVVAVTDSNNIVTNGPDAESEVTSVVPTEHETDPVEIVYEEETFIEVARTGVVETERIVLGTEAVGIAQVESSRVSRLISMPRTTLAYFLSVLLALFLSALLLKVFIAIRIQYPILIVNGLILIVIVAVLLAGNIHYTSLFAQVF